MNNKQYYFLAGLHRSGNTVLSAILNQHPDIYVSPLSTLVEHMWKSHITIADFETTKSNAQDKQRSINIISRLPEIYYEDVDKPAIIDRSKAWTNPDNINLLKTYITKKPKIIFTTRSILECMASFIAIEKKTLVDSMESSSFIQDPILSENENIADFLVSEHSNFGLIRKWAFESIDNPENAEIIHVVKYEDILSTPQETMDNIYNFLELNSFNHNFKNIKKIEEYDDAALGFSKDLHKVRKVLGKGDVRVEDYLTPRSIEKYKDVRYF